MLSADAVARAICRLLHLVLLSVFILTDLIMNFSLPLMIMKLIPPNRNIQGLDLNSVTCRVPIFKGSALDEALELHCSCIQYDADRLCRLTSQCVIIL